MVIDGKKISQRILDSLKEEIKTLQPIRKILRVVSEVEPQVHGKPLRLAGILVGANPSLRKFIELKREAAKEIGVEFRLYDFPQDITNSKLRKKLNEIAKAKMNNGIIIELPLPLHLNTQYILNTIPEEKDVDVLSEKSQGAFFAGRSKILPPAVETIKVIFDEYKIEPKGKTVAIFGYGLLVGRQASHWLMNQGATVMVINEYTPNPEKFSKEADIIISGVGPSFAKASEGKHLITSDLLKDGAVVIDFGKDVDFENVSKKAGLITPPVGGVGPIVIASVFKNLSILAQKARS